MRVDRRLSESAWISASIVEILAVLPGACRRYVESRICSRLFIGSASMPIKRQQRGRGAGDPIAQHLPVVERSAASGAANDFSSETGMPALLPGV